MKFSRCGRSVGAGVTFIDGCMRTSVLIINVSARSCRVSQSIAAALWGIWDWPKKRGAAADHWTIFLWHDPPPIVAVVLAAISLRPPTGAWIPLKYPRLSPPALAALRWISVWVGMTGLCALTGPPHPAALLLWPLTQLWKVTDESHELSQAWVCRGCWESALAGPGRCPKGREQVPKWCPLWPSLGSSTVLVQLCDGGPSEIGLTGCQLYISSSPAFLGFGFLPGFSFSSFFCPFLVSQHSLVLKSSIVPMAAGQFCSASWVDSWW